MNAFEHPRYYRRREKNGFWSLMPLQGPFAADSVMLNDFSARILDLIERGKTLEQILEILHGENPEGDEQKMRVDLFHAASRLNEHGFVDGGGYAQNVQILKNGRRLVPGALQPCPLEHMSGLSDLMLGAREGIEVHWLYNFYVDRSGGDDRAEVPASLYEVERMVKSQATGAEVYWAYVDDRGQLVGGLSSTNYMQMMPVVSITALAVAGEREERATRAATMLSQLAEILSLFGVNQKLRITSCPVASEMGGNMAVFSPECPGVMAECRFKRSATFPREIEGKYNVELYDRVL